MTDQLLIFLGFAFFAGIVGALLVKLPPTSRVRCPICEHEQATAGTCDACGSKVESPDEVQP